MGHFSFQLLIMLGKWMDPQPSHSQCSYPLPGDSMSPRWTLQFQLVLHPALGHPASSPWDLLWSNHTDLSPITCLQHILVSALASADFSANVYHHSLPQGSIFSTWTSSEAPFLPSKSSLLPSAWTISSFHGALPVPWLWSPKPSTSFYSF